MGDPVKGFVSFSLVWSEKSSQYYTFRHSINAETTLFGFNNKGTDFVCPQGVMFTNVFVPIETFHSYANQLQRHDLDDNFLSRNHVELLPTGMQEIKAYFKQLFGLATHKLDWLQDPQVQALIIDDFLPLLISHIPLNWMSKRSPKPSRRAKLIAQAEQTISATLEKPLTLKQLAEALGSSSSALSYGFKDLFGLSPMRYLKVRRLNAVRRRLKISEPDNCAIAPLASQFGFYHPNHFTKDYKAMFGELPSATLRKTEKG
ncbi:MAG: AraC family transcriptional regulator [Cyanothece sp. SIO2G6]|nr:AraC family transcriptional regulator [Cyanothece sp. SIO2G6]